jgi:DNA uptake protein ComE-like DNA-binding protein
MAPGMPAAPKARDSASRSTAAVPNAGLVDINTATAAELQALPGISERDSAKIIHGSPGSTQVSSSKAPSAAFNTNGEVVMRFGVSEATYDKIKDRIVARQQPKS